MDGDRKKENANGDVTSAKEPTTDRDGTQEPPVLDNGTKPAADYTKKLAAEPGMDGSSTRDPGANKNSTEGPAGDDSSSREHTADGISTEVSAANGKNTMEPENGTKRNE